MKVYWVDERDLKEEPLNAQDVPVLREPEAVIEIAKFRNLHEELKELLKGNCKDTEFED